MTLGRCHKVRLTGAASCCKRQVDLGLTVLELLIVIGCLAILAGIIVPAWGRAKHRSGSICCNCNLKQIGLSFRTWALDHRDRYPMQVSTTNGGTMELAGTG